MSDASFQNVCKVTIFLFTTKMFAFFFVRAAFYLMVTRLYARLDMGQKSRSKYL